MSKRFLVGALIIVSVAVASGIFLICWLNQTGRSVTNTPEDFRAFAMKLGRTNSPVPAVPVLLPLSRTVRLAIGCLGLADDDQNRQLEDLLTADLTGAQGFDLVERQSLDAVLKELNLNLSGLVRAKDAVRAGKLVRADWFLLGTSAKINGTNSIVVRMVDARTGILQDAGAFSTDKSSTQLAADVAGFVRQARQNAAIAKTRVYLAVGAFEDWSVNNRLAAFPTQLRGYLTAAYQSGKVTLLEREYVDILLQELRLDLAGLTEEGSASAPVPMQSAFWLVDGYYQSYETTNLQVELALNVQRVFGTTRHFTLRGLPGEPVGRQIKAAIDETMNQDTALLIPTRASEARIQMDIGKELTGWEGQSAPAADFDLVVVGSGWYGNQGSWGSDPQLAAKRKRRLEDAVRVFETVLLLEPTNRQAKMYLAACFRNQIIRNVNKACDYYREIIDEPAQDKWTGLAQQALVETFQGFSPDEKLRWLQSAASQTTNEIATAFYNQQAQEAETDVTINAGDSPKAEEFAEERLFEKIKSAQDYFRGSGTFYHSFGMGEYVRVFGGDNSKAAHKLAELLPKMKRLAPDIAPYLVTSVLTFQVDTNTPVIAEFQAMLADCIEHPNRILNPGQFWSNVGGVYYWCFERTNYPLAVQIMEVIRRVSAEGYVDYGDQEKIELAYAYLATERWQEALNIFEGFTNRPIQTTGGGPWGEGCKPILTDKMVSFCRQKLGLAATQNPRQFDMGEPLLCLCSPSTFIAGDNGLWVGIGGQLLHLDFYLKTNLTVELPVDNDVPITALCLTSSNVWIGTGGAGLIEFDKTSRQCRRLTEADGLMMNYLTSLQVAGDSLWIGYGSATGGGLGQLDLRSQKLKSFMPNLNANQSLNTDEIPPRAKVENIVAGTADDLTMFVRGTFRQYHILRNAWGILPNQAGDWATCFSADSEHLAEGGSINQMEIEIESKPAHTTSTNQIKNTKMVVSTTELNRLRANFKTNNNHQKIIGSSGRIKYLGGLAIQSFRDNRWQRLEDPEGIPNPPTTMTLNGNDLWVGGGGYIALVDVKEGKVRKFCRIQAGGVDHIQIGGGYVWAQFDWHLYRASLSDLR